MKKYFLLIILLIFSWFNPKSMAQFKMPEFEVYGGGFYNRLLPPNDSIKVLSVVSPFAGIGYLMPMNNTNKIITIGAEMNTFASRTSNGNKFRNQTIGPFFRYKHQFLSNFSYGIGVKYNFSFNSYAENGAIKSKIPDYSDILSIDAGIYYRLQKYLSLACKYELPVFGSKVEIFPSFKIELILDINDDILQISKHIENKNTSKDIISKQASTAMVILLSSRSNSIDALNKAELFDKAKFLNEKVYQSNLRLYSAATLELTVYPLYFIYMDDLELLIEQKTTGIFLNSNLVRDSSIVLSHSFYLLGRLGSQIEGEHRTTDSVYYPVSDYNNFGFYIYDKNFKLNKSPFPTYTRIYFYPDDDEKESNANVRAFKKINKRLTKYLNGEKEKNYMNNPYQFNNNNLN